MKSKILSLFGLVMLSVIVCLLVSAASTTFSVSPSTITFTPTDNSEDIVVTNLTAPVSVDITTPTITTPTQTITFNGGVTSSLVDGATTFTITPITAINFSDIAFGESFTGNLTITDSSSPTDTETITVRVENNRFCEYANPGDLDVRSIDVINNGIGDDDKWYPYDILEVEVKVENDGSEDIQDITLEWGVYDSNGEWIIEPVDEDEFDLDEDDEDVITFEIDLDDDLDVDLDELNDGSYDLYVRVTGERRDSEDMTCASDSENIDIIIENDYVILKNLEVVGTPYCGSTIQVKADVLNIGEDDQKDVLVSIYNKDLGVNEETIIEDLDAFEDKKLVFEFSIPSDLEEKTYLLLLEVFDEDGDLYESSDDDLSEYNLPLSVSGNCVKEAEATVYASLESGGKAGQEMEIRASVTNTGSEEQTFTIKAADYSSWAELVSIEPSTLTLEADEERDVIITLDVDSDAPEESTFSVVVEDESGETVTQPISVTIEKGFSLKGLFGDKGYVWGIILLNAILIIVIIVVAIRVARR